MKQGLSVLLIVVVLVAGEWIYRGFVRPVDALTPDVLALGGYFDKNGIAVRPYAVRHSFRHTEVLAAAALEIKGFPLAIAIDVCPNSAAADRHLAVVAISPNLTHPAVNGRLVMYLPMWGDDTGDIARKVTGVFSSFHAGT